MCCCRAEKSDAQAICSCELRPFAFVLVVNERSKNERDVAFDLFTLRVNNVVTSMRQDRRNVAQLNAGQVLEDGSNVLGEARHYGISAKARPVTTGDGVFVDKATASFQIREYKSLQDSDT